MTITRNSRTIHCMSQKTACFGILTCLKSQCLQMAEMRWLPQFLLLERKLILSL